MPAHPQPPPIFRVLRPPTTLRGEDGENNTYAINPIARIIAISAITLQYFFEYVCVSSFLSEVAILYKRKKMSCMIGVDGHRARTSVAC